MACQRPIISTKRNDRKLYLPVLKLEPYSDALGAEHFLSVPSFGYCTTSQQFVMNYGKLNFNTNAELKHETLLLLKIVI